MKRLVRRLIGDPAVSLEEMPDAPALFRWYRRLLATGHRRVPGGWVWEGEFYPDCLTVGGNSHAIRRVALRWCVGRGLDVGAGLWPLPGATPVDTAEGPGRGAAIEDFPEGSQDFVFSSHCLEHIADWREALASWAARLRPGGVLFLYLPHPSCGLWRADNPAMRGVHAWIPTFEVVRDALQGLGLEIAGADEGPDGFASFYLVARKGSASPAGDTAR